MTKDIEFSDNNKELMNSVRLFYRPVIFLSIIGIISITIRLIYFPLDVPLTLDSLNYFWYSSDFSLTGEFPRVDPDIPATYVFHFPNNGWPLFVSLFFSFTDSWDFLDLTNLQRIISMSISVITIVPLYYLCRRFFNKNLSIIGIGIFAFHPLLIQNSLLGITEPLFIFLGTISIWLFLSKDYKIIIISFIVAGLFTLVKYD